MMGIKGMVSYGKMAMKTLNVSATSESIGVIMIQSAPNQLVRWDCLVEEQSKQVRQLSTAQIWFCRTSWIPRLLSKIVDILSKLICHSKFISSAITSASHPLSSHPCKPENTTTAVLCSGGMELFSLPQNLMCCRGSWLMISETHLAVKSQMQVCRTDWHRLLQTSCKMQKSAWIHQREFDTQSCRVHSLQFIVNTHGLIHLYNYVIVSKCQFLGLSK